MHDDSCIGINYAHMFPKCFRSLHTLLGFALYFVLSIQLLSLYPFIQFLTCTRILCRDSHCENGSFEVLSLHTPKALQTACGKEVYTSIRPKPCVQVQRAPEVVELNTCRCTFRVVCSHTHSPSQAVFQESHGEVRFFLFPRTSRR